VPGQEQIATNPPLKEQVEASATADPVSAALSAIAALLCASPHSRLPRQLFEPD
jgi:hypothetical protein